jgi:hypothetical protein
MLDTTAIAPSDLAGSTSLAGLSSLAAIPDPGTPGPLAVTYQEYSFGDTAFQPTDFAALPGSPRVELTASVQAPTDLSKGPYPLIILLHGRHSTTYDPTTGSATNEWPPQSGRLPIPSYRGYDYLGSILASHGYIVVSISANGISAHDNDFYNGFDGGIRARAELIQRHLDLWRDFNRDGITPFGAPFGTRFVGKVDLQNIGLMGHSRGGEGVVRSYLYNQSLGSPYGIKAVFALAPSDFNRFVLHDVPLAVLLPYNDGDLSDLEGVHFFDDALQSTTGDVAPEHLFVVMGANHDFYNTVWTPGVFPYPGAPQSFGGTWDDGFPGPPTRLTPAQEDGTAVATVSAFFRTYLGHEDQFRAFLRGDAAPPPSAQVTANQLVVSYEATADPLLRRDINSMLTLGNMTTDTLGGDVITSGLQSYTIYGGVDPEQRFLLPGEPGYRYPHTVYSPLALDRRGLSQLVLSYGTTQPAYYENDLPPGTGDASDYYALDFRASVIFSSPLNPPGTPQDFTVTLADGEGNTASTQVGIWSGSPFYPPGGPTPSGALDLPKQLLNDVRIPLAAFAGIDLADVRSVRFSFDQRSQGALLFSDLAFSDPASLYAGPFVASSTPSSEVTGPISHVQVTFNTPIDASTFTPSDIVFTDPTGVVFPVTGVAVVPGTGNSRFNITFDPRSIAGTYTLRIGPDVRDMAGRPMDGNFNSVAGEATGDWQTVSFRIQGPRIVASTPSGNVPAPVSSVQVTFATPMDPTTFTPDDVLFTGPGGFVIPVTGVSVVPGSGNLQFTVAFPTQNSVPGFYTMVIGPDIRDPFGNPMDQNDDLVLGQTPADQYTATFRLLVPDAAGDTLATAQLTGLGPANGSFGATAYIGDGLYLNRDVDLYRFDASAGQALIATTAPPPGGTAVDTLLSLFDASGSLVSTGNFLNSGHNTRLDYYFAAGGVYYLGVSGRPNQFYDPQRGGSGFYTGSTGDYLIDLTLLTPTPDLVGDTMDTALATRLGPNAGTYTGPIATLGDGLYLHRDVDLYRFDAASAQALSATVTLPDGSPATNVVLSLFDAAGDQLMQAIGLPGLPAQLDFTTADHGTYYLGVSGYPDLSYDPNRGGSGPLLAQTTDYRLAMSLTDLRPQSIGGPAQPVDSVRGSALWHDVSGLPDGGNYHDKISINAWLDPDGTAHGTIAWTSEYNPLPGGGGRTISGFPYIIRVDTLIISGNTAHIEGVVVNSGQQPGDIGLRISFDVVDNGRGSLDELNGDLIQAGNLTVR